MKLNQNKKDELLNLTSCSKDLLIWIQLQPLQEDVIELTHKHYTKGVKVSLNTFNKALGGLLDLKVLFATSKKGKFKLNKEFIADSDHNGLGDFKQRKMWVVDPSRIPILDYNIKSQMVDLEYTNKLNDSLVKLKTHITERLKTESVEEIKKNLIESFETTL